MIKIQQKNNSQIHSQQYKICLSPFCFNPKNRIIPVNNQQYSHRQQYLHDKQQCSKWVQSIQDLTSPITSYKLKQLSNVELNFNEQPIQTLRKIARLQKSDWKKQLTKQINNIKKQINNALEAMEATLDKKVNQILNKKQILTDIMGIIDKSFVGGIQKQLNIEKKVPSSNNSNKQLKKTQQMPFSHFSIGSNIQQSYRLSQQLTSYFFTNVQSIIQMKSIHFLKKFQIKQQINQIKQSILLLQKKIVSQKSSIKVRSQERVQFYEWIFQKQQNMFNKIQIIAALFNMKPNNYHVQGEVIKLNCFLCEKYVIQKISPTHIKQLKKFMAQQLIIHMYNQHHDRVFYSYLKKIAKTSCKQLSIKQILEKFDTLEQLHIVDRQTGVSYTQDFVSSEVQAIDILTKKNVHLAKNNYILIESKQSINSLISILMHEAAEKKKKIMVISNRFQHLDQVKKMFNIESVQVMKKYDGMQWVKYQQQRIKQDPPTVTTVKVKKSSNN